MRKRYLLSFIFSLMHLISFFNNILINIYDDELYMIKLKLIVKLDNFILKPFHHLYLFFQYINEN